MIKSVVIIVNPMAKKASEQKIQLSVGLLRSTGYDVRVYITEKKGDAENLARKASEDGESLIIAAGGDGTFNEVMNAVVYTRTKMAIIPMGTTNVLAKELGIPEDMEGAVNRVLYGKVHSVSPGNITFTRQSSAVTRYFLLMAGIGFDGSTVYNISESLKRYSGKGAYILSGLKTLIGYSPELLTFAVDGTKYTGYSAIIGKASRYGGNFMATPDASLPAPWLYIYIMHGKRRLDILRYARGIITGTQLRFKDITYLKAAVIEVHGVSHMQTDGDYLGITPATITVAPDALQMVY